MKNIRTFEIPVRNDETLDRVMKEIHSTYAPQQPKPLKDLILIDAHTNKPVPIIMNNRGFIEGKQLY